MTTKVLHCGCEADHRGNTKGAEFQNEQFGVGRRVVNEMPAKTVSSRDTGWRCSVCGMQVTLGQKT